MDPTSFPVFTINCKTAFFHRSKRVTINYYIIRKKYIYVRITIYSSKAMDKMGICYVCVKIFAA